MRFLQILSLYASQMYSWAYNVFAQKFDIIQGVLTIFMHNSHFIASRDSKRFEKSTKRINHINANFGRESVIGWNLYLLKNQHFWIRIISVWPQWSMLTVSLSARESQNSNLFLDHDTFSWYHLIINSKLRLLNYLFQYTMEWFFDNCPISINQHRLKSKCAV